MRQSLLSPTYAMFMLMADMLVYDYRAGAKQMDGKVPVLYVLSEPNVEMAVPWIKANTPNASTFTIKRHMSFWSNEAEMNLWSARHSVKHTIQDHRYIEPL